MGIQVILHQPNLLGVGIIGHQCLHKLGIVHFGALCSHLGKPKPPLQSTDNRCLRVHTDDHMYTMYTISQAASESAPPSLPTIDTDVHRSTARDTGDHTATHTRPARLPSASETHWSDARCTIRASARALTRFFSPRIHRGRRDRVHGPDFNDLVGQQADCPALASLRRICTGQRRQIRFSGPLMITILSVAMPACADSRFHGRATDRSAWLDHV